MKQKTHKKALCIAIIVFTLLVITPMSAFAASTTPPKISKVTTDLKSGQLINTEIKLVATASGGSGDYTYQFSYKLGNKETQIPATDINNNTATFKTETPGAYTFLVKTTDGNGKQSVAYKLNYKIIDSISVKTMTIDKKSPQNIGTTLKLSATGKNGKTPYQYSFAYSLNNATPVEIQAFEKTNAIKFTPKESGDYIFITTIKDASGNIAEKKSNVFTITNLPVINKINTDIPAPQSINTPITLSIDSIGGSGASTYEISYKIGSAPEVSIPASQITNNKTVFTPSIAGNYIFSVKAIDEKGNTSAIKKSNSYKITEPVTVKKFTTNKTAPQNIGETLKLSATATGGKSPYQYQFTAQKEDGSIRILRDYTTTSSVSFVPYEVGDYHLTVTIKDANGNISKATTLDYAIKNEPVLKSFTTEAKSGQPIGSDIKLIAGANGGAGGADPYVYQFTYTLNGVESAISTDSIKGNIAHFVPTEAGTYTFAVTVVDSQGNTSKTMFIKNIKVVPTVSIKTLTIKQQSPQKVGTELQLTTSAINGKTPYQYQFYYSNDDGKTIVPIGARSKTTSIKFTPNKAGTYTLYADVMDKSGKISIKQVSAPFVITDDVVVIKNPVIKTFESSLPSGQTIGAETTLSTIVTDGSGNYNYDFSYQINGETKQSITTTNTTGTTEFTLNNVGTYTFTVIVTDLTTKQTATKTIADYKVLAPVVSVPSLTSITSDQTSPQIVYTAITLHAIGATGGTEPYTYQFYSTFENGTKTPIGSAQTSDTLSYTPTIVGSYQFAVELIDKNGTHSKPVVIAYQINAKPEIPIEVPPTTPTEGYVVISNEATNVETAASTGTITSVIDSLATQSLMDGEETDSDAYRINPVIPLDEDATPIDVQANMLSANEIATIDSIKNFKVYNYITQQNDTRAMRLAYSGTNVDVWVEATPTTIVITNDMATKIGTEFETNIHGLIRDNFYTESDLDSNGKINILCCDLTDGYIAGSGMPYLGGLFNPNDLTNSTTSNQAEIIYADTWPSMGTNTASPDVTRIYPTLAHEFQHMVNFNGCMLDTTTPHNMSIWLNESLSEAASQLYSGTQTGRIARYNSSDEIRNGKSLLDWDNSLASYSLSYLFGQYLRTQVEQTDNSVKIFNELIKDPSESAPTAIEHVAQKYIDPNITFGQVMTNFRGALLMKNDTGVYGFNNESAFDALQTPLYSGTTRTIKGGGALVKTVSLPFVAPSDKGSAVTYTTFNK